MVSAREAADGGLATVNRPGGGGSGTPRADQVLPERGRKQGVRTTSREAAPNMLGERQVGGRLDVRSARPEVTLRQQSMCMREVRKQRPNLPAQRVVMGKMIAGLTFVFHEDGVSVIITCPSPLRWTTGLKWDAFPGDVLVEKFGDNAVIIRPLPVPPAAPYVVTTPGTRA